MHSHTIAQWAHSHSFLGAHHDHHERRTWTVVIITAVMMVGEIAGGTVFGSMALVADGWHMATHVAALAIAGLAYMFARRHAHDARFSLGTGKFGELAAFASAVILAMIALAVGYEAVVRLIHPVPIHFREAIPIAALGLVVNLVSAWVLQDDHEHHDNHGAVHHDTNWRAAYVHVLTDALTSVLAIVALVVAWTFGWLWIDPVVALVGMAVIVSWAAGLIRSAGGVLLDTIPDPDLAGLIRTRMEVGGDRLADLHVWRVGPGHTAVIVSVVSDSPQAPAVYKRRLNDLHGLSHVTVEVHACT